MARNYTTTQLVNDIKRRASIPSNQALFSDNDIIQFMDEELHSNLVPLILANREEYFVTPYEVDIVPDQLNYNIPTRAIGTKLRDVTLVLASGELYNIARWSPEMRASRARRINYDRPSAFVVQGNAIQLYPTARSSGTMRMDYFRRPGHLVAVSETAKVTSIDTVTNRVTTTSRPITWVTGDAMDITSNQPPFNHIDDLTIVSLPSPTVIELSDVTGIEIGDYISLARETPIPTIPEEGHNVIKQMAIVKIYESLGDTDEMKTAQAKYEEMVGHFRTLIADRVEGESKKCVGGTNIQQYTANFRRNSGWW